MAHLLVIPMKMGIQIFFCLYWIPASRLCVARYGGRRKVAGMTANGHTALTKVCL